jgi:ATP/maltotriose-dependent transcriptional regulator MalT
MGLGWTALAAGEERRARELFEEALPLYADADDRFEMALLLGFLGELAWARGELDAARRYLEDGAELARAMGAPFPLVRCLCGLANTAREAGDVEAAAAVIDEAYEICTASRLPYALVRCLQVRGALRDAGGETAKARRDYDDALSVAQANGDGAGAAQSLFRLAGVAKGAGADDDALRLLHEALVVQAEIGNAGVASSLEAIAAIAGAQGRPAHGARLFAAAESLRDACGATRRPDETGVYEAGMAILRTMLDADELAVAWADGAALSRDDAVAAALRGRGPRDLDRPSRGWASLTPGERQIVDLVMTGMTNREIADKLFISDRTVQSHLGRVFPKLGVTSRRQLRESRRGPE